MKLLAKYDITPVPKPRMTRRDRWDKDRPAVQRYWAYKDKIRAANIQLPEKYWIVFNLPMSKSWTKKEKSAQLGQPHLQTPDKDNLEKGLLDALFKKDAHIWYGGCEKRWALKGSIWMYDISQKGISSSILPPDCS